VSIRSPTNRRNRARTLTAPVQDQRNRFGGTPTRGFWSVRRWGLDLTGLITAATRTLTAAEAARLETCVPSPHG